MKMNLLKGDLMHSCFGLCQPREYRNTLFLYGWRQAALVDDLFDVGEMPVMMSIMVTLKGNHCLSSSQASLQNLLWFDLVVVQTQFIQFTAQHTKRKARIQKRPQDHVSAGSREAVKVGDSHAQILTARP
jgi:hypothetical protein